MHTSYVSENNMDAISSLSINIFEKKVMMKNGAIETNFKY